MSADTKDRLIESTRELLLERGYANMSPRAILDSAGVGQGSMYHHFQGKSDLALAAIERNAEEMRGQVAARSSDLQGAVHDMFVWLREQLVTVFAEGQSAEELPSSLNPAQLAATTMATLQGGYVLARATQDVTAFDAAIDGVLDLLTLLGPDA